MSKELLFSITKKDLTIQTFRAGGPGGQNQNKRNTGVRIKHDASGAVAESREFRTQLENKRAAMLRLSKHPKLVAWIRFRAAEMGNSIDEAVAKQMLRKNLVVEVKSAGKWVSE